MPIRAYLLEDVSVITIIIIIIIQYLL